MVVLNWNGRSHLQGSLGSLEKLDYPSELLELILVDNGSEDGSLEFAAASHPRWRVLSQPRNLGFAAANNLGTEAATGDWVGFFNNDMRAEPDWLRTLLTGLDECPGAACLASRILSWDGAKVDFAGGSVNYQGHGNQPAFGHPAGDTPQESRRLLFACGGAMLVRRDVFKAAGGFDPAFFAYFEDVDLGWRLNLLGHDVWFAAAATAFHHHHSTGGRIAPHRLRVLYERNALFTIYKNLDDANLAAALPAALLLLNERALLLSGVDREQFQFGTPALPTRPPVDAAPQVGGLRQAARGLRRRLAAPAAPTGAMPVEPIALSHYVALSEFAHSLSSLSQRRQQIQLKRVRSDAEIIHLAGDLLYPNWMDERYLRFYDWLNRVQGLDQRFGGAGA